MKFQHAYSDSFRGSDLECKDPSLTQQQFAQDADINVMLERFKVTGFLPQGAIAPTYGDFTGVTDFQSAANAVLKATNAFNELPANIRARFQNSPQAYLEFCSNPDNIVEMRKLGIAVPEKPAVGVSGASAPDAKPSVDVKNSS